VDVCRFSATEPTALNGGVQMIGLVTPTSQLGPEEPVAFPKDSRYVYYSQNSVQTSTFQYSQNVHQGLYSIYLRDTQKNTSSMVVGGYGGAARPSPSRDGSSLAFVRRLTYTTGMCVCVTSESFAIWSI
jgi:hypothetical protein